MTAPDGRTWLVRRRWVPRLGAESLGGRLRRRFGRTVKRGEHVDLGWLELFGEHLAVLAAAIAIGLVLVFFVVPLLVALVDVLILLLLALLGLLARIALRRPWIVEARSADGTELRWRVVGWGASGEHCDEVALLLQSGVTPPH